MNRSPVADTSEHHNITQTQRDGNLEEVHAPEPGAADGGPFFAMEVQEVRRLVAGPVIVLVVRHGRCGLNVPGEETEIVSDEEWTSIRHSGITCDANPSRAQEEMWCGAAPV